MAVSKKTKTAKQAPKPTRSIDFTFNSQEAGKVMLAGDFNNWDYEKTPLKKVADNTWKRTLKLKPGRYEYKFVVDGNWTVDPKNDNRAWSALGVENSVIEI